MGVVCSPRGVPDFRMRGNFLSRGGFLPNYHMAPIYMHPLRRRVIPCPSERELCFVALRLSGAGRHDSSRADEKNRARRSPTCVKERMWSPSFRRRACLMYGGSRGGYFLEGWLFSVESAAWSLVALLPNTDR